MIRRRSADLEYRIASPSVSCPKTDIRLSAGAPFSLNIAARPFLIPCAVRSLSNPAAFAALENHCEALFGERDLPCGVVKKAPALKETLPDYCISWRRVTLFWVKAALRSWKLGRGDTSTGWGRAMLQSQRNAALAESVHSLRVHDFW